MYGKGHKLIKNWKKPNSGHFQNYMHDIYMIYNYARWKVPLGPSAPLWPQRTLMDPYGPARAQTAPNGPQRPQTAPDGPDGPRRPLMAPDPGFWFWLFFIQTFVISIKKYLFLYLLSSQFRYFEIKKKNFEIFFRNFELGFGKKTKFENSKIKISKIKISKFFFEFRNFRIKEKFRN